MRTGRGGVQKACFFSAMLGLLLFLQMLEPFLIFKIKDIKKMTSVFNVCITLESTAAHTISAVLGTGPGLRAR